MRTILIIILSAIVSVSVQAQPITVGKTAPDWGLLNAAGEPIQYYEDSEGKVSVILFWATWCPYCSRLMPHLEVVYRKYRSKGVKFYAINVFEDGKLDPVEQFKKHKYSFTQLLDGDEVADAYGIKGTPGLLVVGKDKQVIYKRPSGVSEVLVKQNVDLKIKSALKK